MRNVAVLTLTGVLSQGVAFVYRVLLTRLAGAEVLGLYQLILPLYSVLLSLTGVGLYTAMSNLSARYAALGDLRAIDAVRRQVVGAFYGLAVVPCAALLIFSDAASVYLLGDARTQLGLMLLVPCLLLTGTETLHKHYFYGVGRVVPAAVTELLEQLLRAGFILGLLVALRPGTAERTVGTVVLGMACCEVCAAATQLVLFRAYLGAPRRLPGTRPPGAALRRQIRQIALPLGAAALLGNLISSANAVLIPRLLVRGGMDQSEAVAAYGVTFGMTLPLLMLPTAFLSALGLVLTPKLAQCLALGRRDAVRRHVRRAVGATDLILIPALALLAVLGPELGARLYGEPTVGAHLPLLALGVLFSCWQGLLCCVLSGVDRQGTSAVLCLVCDGAQLVLTCALVGRVGMVGYAAAFTATALLGAALHWAVVAKETGLRLPVGPWLLIPSLAAALAAACAELMQHALLRGGLGDLGAACGALGFGLLVYLAGLQAMGAREALRDEGACAPDRSRVE